MIFCYLMCNSYVLGAFVLMLEPAGDAQHAGRPLQDTFERGITLQICKHLKKNIEMQNIGVQVILAHHEGERIEPLQHAQIANRMAVDLYVSMHCHAHELSSPHIALYAFKRDQSVNQVYDNQLSFVPYDLAYLFSETQTHRYAAIFHQVLLDKAHKKYTVSSLYALPFKPLVGIQSSAFAIELGLNQKNEWMMFINPLIQAFMAMIIENNTNKQQQCPIHNHAKIY